MPGPSNEVSRIRQDVYPYAQPEPVSHMAPGQSVFGTEQTRGGWFVATRFLNDTLVGAGLPQSPPTGGDDSGFPWTLAGAPVALASALALLVLAVRRIRRRPGAAAA